jgi:hypothetical protein
MPMPALAAFLHVVGLVDHQCRLVIVQMLHHVAAHVIAELIGIPFWPGRAGAAYRPGWSPRPNRRSSLDYHLVWLADVIRAIGQDVTS